MKKILVALCLLSAAGAARAGIVWDSDTIASGATSTSPLLKIDGVRELEVFVDNTSGGGFRDLTMISFAPDGVTTIDSVLLRRVAWGAKANGAQHDPGRARGYIGPNPPGTASSWYTLYSATGSANADHTFSGLLTEDAELVNIQLTFSGGLAGAVNTNYIASSNDDGGALNLASFNVGAAAQTSVGILIAPAASGTAANSAAFVAMPIPRRLGGNMRAAGTGISTTVVVLAKGRPPGTFAVQTMIPTRVRFSVGAANGTARVWVNR